MGLKTENLRTFETLRVERLSLLKTLAYHDARDVGWQRLKVVEGGCGVPDYEVDRDEEAAEDDTQRPADDGEEDILLEEDRVPGGVMATSVSYSASTDRRA